MVLGLIRPRPGGFRGKHNEQRVVPSTRLQFQSAPSPVAGGNGRSVVSIRSRPEDRGETPRGLHCSYTSSFNPPPAQWPGETPPSECQKAPTSAVEFQSAPGPVARGKRHTSVPPRPTTPFERLGIVSIRPRPSGQGKPFQPANAEQLRYPTGFNPPPARGKRRWPCAGASKRSTGFQSAPSPLAGRSFNPPPARRPGETIRWVPLPATLAVAAVVSIRPRPSGQGKPS